MLPFEKSLAGKTSVLILGFGREGRSSYAFFQKYYPSLKLGIADRNEALHNENLRATLHLGENYLDALGQYDLVMKSPGVKIGNSPEEGKDKITSQTGLFLKEFGDRIIGVTGTKGKSTTASLLRHLLKNSGKDALLLGNIGLPAFDFLPDIKEDTLIVYELSAHQLERVDASPHIGVLLNIYPEHLDYFGSFDAYRQAKLNLFRFQKPEDKAFCGEKISTWQGKCEMPGDLDSVFETELLLQKAKLRGVHNLKNILLAFRVLQYLGVPLAALPEALEGFHGLPHRLEYVGQFEGVDFYNDSISTVPQSTMAAVKSLPEADALILGGFDRGLDYRELVSFLEHSSVRNFFFMGKAGERMRALFHANGKQKLFSVSGLSEVFDHLAEMPEVRCCLLSPAAASYDQFHNFEHRGDLFKQLASRFRRS